MAFFIGKFYPLFLDLLLKIGAKKRFFKDGFY